MEGASGVGDPLSGRELAAFVAAVEAGTVQGAADALELTQSAASKRIQGLEHRLGVPLLDRDRTGVRTTDAGRLLYPEAKLALEALRRAADVVVGDRARGVPLRLAASHTIGEFLLPGWLGAYRATVGGEVRPEVDIVNSQGVLAAVRGGAAAIGFVEGPDALDGLATLTLVRDEIVAVVSVRHPWAARRSVPASLLVDEPFLTRERGSGTRAVAAASLSARGISLAPALEVASTQSLKRAVQAGGFTLISRLAVEAEARAGVLCALRVSGVDLRRELRAVRRRRLAAGDPARRFWRWLEREVDDAGAR